MKLIVEYYRYHNEIPRFYKHPQMKIGKKVHYTKGYVF